MNKKRVTRRTFLKGAGLTLMALGGIRIPVGRAQGDFVEMKAPYSSGSELPRFNVPLNAIDCHHHIYDSRFPVDPNSTLRHPDATVADYRMLQERLGTTRNIIVQPSTYGVDNRGLVEALKEFGLENTRGIAVVNTSVTDAELAEMDKAGVRGIRFNMSVPGAATNMDMVETLAQRVHELGWHIQVVAKPDTIFAGKDLWNKVPCPVVFDHLGHITSTEQPAFEVILNLLRQGKGWVKLSGAYILSKVGSPTYADRTIIAKAYVNEAPGQLVWGSDWPHPTSKMDNKPDDAILLSLLAEWAPDENLQRQILVDNPARLYGF